MTLTKKLSQYRDNIEVLQYFFDLFINLKCNEMHNIDSMSNWIISIQPYSLVNQSEIGSIG